MSQPTACRVLVEGIVQGVGFRPFVHAIARQYQLAGRVRNTSHGVEIEVEGEREEIGEFVAALRDRPPPLARIERIEAQEIVPSGVEGFRIDPSADGDGFLPISADIATCEECLREVEDVSDRRFGYAFTNCTSCGPRFTILRSVPYDRPNTTMAEFAMCSACRAEYEDPTDRRFHAEPIACPQCGPSLALLDATGRTLPGDPLTGIRRALADGRIVAIKGIGGFHLACDARQEMAVRRLRRRKVREGKPFALMAADLAEAERLCFTSARERRLLESRARPIVVLRERPDSGIAASVARPLCHLGVMLPYSPLHPLLFSDAACPRALVLDQREPLRRAARSRQRRSARAARRNCRPLSRPRPLDRGALRRFGRPRGGRRGAADPTLARLRPVSSPSTPRIAAAARVRGRPEEHGVRRARPPRVPLTTCR